MKPRNLDQICVPLTQLARVMCTDQETDEQSDAYYELMEGVLNLPPELEAQVHERCQSLLVAAGLPEVALWLHEDFEHDAMLASFDLGQGREEVGVFFAIPVVLASSDSLESFASTEAFERLHDVLREAMVLSEHARFGLCNRLVGVADLLVRTPGEVKRMGQGLAEQVRQGESLLSLDPELVLEPAHGAGPSSESLLYFILGSAVVPDVYLDDAFPDLAELDEMTEAQLSGRFVATNVTLMGRYGLQREHLSHTGYTEAGQKWQEAFQEAFNTAFSTMEGALAVVAPIGLYEDVRAGMECAREMGLLMEIRSWGVERDMGAWVTTRDELDPLKPECFHLEVFVDVGEDEPTSAGTTEWLCLPHESLEESRELMEEVLQDMGLKVFGSFDEPQFPEGSHQDGYRH